MPKNKVRYNLKNVHYAPLSFAANGAPSYETPAPIPGAVSLSLDPSGAPENFYADGGVYFVINNNMGYDGDLEIAMIPEDFRIGPLGEELDANAVVVERSDVQLVPFALLFEFDGDQKHIRHVLYNCTASRPKLEGKTVEDKKQVQTETLNIKAVPLPDGVVKAKTGDDTGATAYDGWYNAVYLPVAASTPASGSGSSGSGGSGSGGSGSGDSGSGDSGSGGSGSGDSGTTGT